MSLRGCCYSLVCHVSLLAVAAAPASSSLAKVFTAKELSGCTRFRLPQLVRNSDSGAIHVLANCCGKNRCSSKSFGGDYNASDDFGDDFEDGWGDDFSDSKVVMKTSTDEGLTWGAFQTVSPKGRDHYASGAGIYDKVRRKLVVQYQHYPLGSTKPVTNTTYLQITSSNDGKTWSAATDISKFIDPGCNDNRKDNNKVYQSAGSKVQTPSGRLVWPGKAQGGPVCVWYSDDGGATYKTSNLVTGNEVSVTFVSNKQPDELYMNGRGQQFAWGAQGYRTEYRSLDGGATWSKGNESQLNDGDAGQVEWSLRHIGAALFAAAPSKAQRESMKVHCSRDDGRSWPSSFEVKDTKDGGYSDLVGLKDNKKLLLLWEEGSAGNFVAGQYDTSFCTKPAGAGGGSS